MSSKTNREQLVSELLSDPRNFSERGRAYQLLQEYFGGADIDTLRPLLRHKDELVRRAAVFVASELGSAARSLISDVAALVTDPDPRIQWDALESVMINSVDRADKYIYLIAQALEDKSDSIRRLAMRLLSNASQAQIEAALATCHKLRHSVDTHRQGLTLLAAVDRASKDNEIKEFLDSDQPLLAVYAAIAAKRMFGVDPSLLAHAVQNSNSDIARFSTEAVESMSTSHGGHH